MSFPTELLVAKGGELTGYLFENKNIGFPRTLFFVSYIHFEEVQYLDEDFECSLNSEDIPFTGRDWRSLEQIDFTAAKAIEQINMSFYDGEHHFCHDIKGKFTYLGEDKYKIRQSAKIDYMGYDGDDAHPNLPVSAEAILTFDGIRVGKDNLSKPASATDAKEALAEFLDLDLLQDPDESEWHYNFKPRW
ncbi:hypothetical protein [Denitrobaculum tricleocarpae]|uniref:Uncharacterized protein n=1 Tax=Denitrobaculum tricleocarpae TaxID=2591009 RepID=A0A545TKP5_9PROT|nr:hypothetical protein [Denitrobaculum tricleocarpae]TQV77777.1 hypothetical protein FKG95_19650 [Denitrobaculum tricleocarpae]